MKKMLKIGGGLLLVGLVLLLIGLFNHGNRIVTFQSGRPTIVSTKKQTAHVIPQGNPQKIHVDATGAQVTIRRGTKYQVSFSGRQPRPQIKATKDEIFVKAKDHGGVVSLAFNDENYTLPRIEITVPAAVELKQLTVNITDGVLHLDGVTAKQTALTTSDTDITLSRSSLEDGKLDITDGELVGQNGTSLKQISVRSSDTDVDFHQVTLDGTNIDNADGDVEGNDITISNRVTIRTSDGDNELRNVTAQGFILRGGDENVLHGHHSSDTIRDHAEARDVLELITNSDGDNEIM